MKPTTSQYEKAITRLAPRQIEILQAFYYQPDSTVTASELAEVLNYKSFHGANRQIGAIGEAIAKHTGVKPPTYIDRGIKRSAYFAMVGGDYTSRGWKMVLQLKKALENLGLVEKPSTRIKHAERLPTEIQPFEEAFLYKEGLATRVMVNRYERNQRARLECIRHHGAVCKGCGFDFGHQYGKSAEGFIHVHHHVPLSEIGKNYTVDPIKDLIPLCPNCHSVVHFTNPALSIDELRRVINKSGKSRRRHVS